ncbi:hypothetical protein MTR67_038352 [Solanum verrucosum]|uniref:Uncharacterized protein n=1 Tax=Solanum verrucosum TaxID=315347 RepID=A0AAF0UFC5_SOLVR|nr:hypothetical protein MTR67_038352 [Solanum verrucosum]
MTSGGTRILQVGFEATWEHPHFTTDDGFGPLLEQMVQAICWHVSDDSPTVRRLCLRGLVQVLEFSSRDAVEPVLLDLSIRLRNLQVS